jgi:hypothetical protein
MRAVNRRGFSTAELLVAVVFGGVIAASVVTVLRKQQRFFAGAATLVERRVSLRDATAILQSELRALSPAGGDVLAYSDSALEIRTTIGAAIACDTLIDGTGIDLAPARVAPAVTLAGFSTTPQAADIALVLDPGVTPGPVGEAWVGLEIASATTVANACLTSPLVDAVRDATTSRLRLRFNGVRVPAGVRPGAFVRVLRRARYRLYRASTGEWYLGYAEWDGTAFGVVQPVSGPFASYSRQAGVSGIALRYFDEAGAELTPPTDAVRIARVEVVARAPAGVGLSQVPQAIVDSQAVTIRVRNR